MAKCCEGYGYKTFVWLVGMVFIKKGFVEEIGEKGIWTLADECPIGNDLTDEQAKRFMAAYDNGWLKLLVKVYWLVYEYLVDHTDASIQSPWQP